MMTKIESLRVFLQSAFIFTIALAFVMCLIDLGIKHERHAAVQAGVAV